MDTKGMCLLDASNVNQLLLGGTWKGQPIRTITFLCQPLSWENMALRELSSLEKYLGLKKPNKYSTQGDKKVT